MTTTIRAFKEQCKQVIPIPLDAWDDMVYLPSVIEDAIVAELMVSELMESNPMYTEQDRKLLMLFCVKKLAEEREARMKGG